jgi:hypothetical protein
MIQFLFALGGGLGKRERCFDGLVPTGFPFSSHGSGSLLAVEPDAHDSVALLNRRRRDFKPDARRAVLAAGLV